MNNNIHLQRTKTLQALRMQQPIIFSINCVACRPHPLHFSVSSSLAAYSPLRDYATSAFQKSRPELWRALETICRFDAKHNRLQMWWGSLQIYLGNHGVRHGDRRLKKMRLNWWVCFRLYNIELIGIQSSWHPTSGFLKVSSRKG
jgi:hypothetical protein